MNDTMKSMLRSWHEDAQKSDLSTGLEAAEEASRLDEAFFRKVYAEKLEEWIAWERAYTQEIIGDLRAEHGKNADALIDRERTIAAKDWKNGSSGLFLAPDAPMRFDETAARKAYATILRRMVRACEAAYPASILAAVADRRLLALGVASPRVLELAEAHDAQFRARMKQTSAAIQKRRRAVNRKYPQFRRFHFHDDVILSFRKRGRDIVMTLNTPVKLIFCGAELIRSDGRLNGADWLYEEIRPLDGGYEIEILADRRTSGALETVLRCRDIEIIKDAIPRQGESSAT